MALTGASRLAPIPLRLAVGSACLFHAYDKLFAGPSFHHFIDQVKTLGLERPELLAHGAAWTGLAGGIMLVLGFGTRVAALLNGITIGVILWKVKLGGDPAQVLERLTNGFIGPEGYMTALVLLLACLSIVLTGAGALSLDSVLARRKDSTT